MVRGRDLGICADYVYASCIQKLIVWTYDKKRIHPFQNSPPIVPQLHAALGGVELALASGNERDFLDGKIAAQSLSMQRPTFGA